MSPKRLTLSTTMNFVNAAKSELMVFGLQNRYVRDLTGRVLFHGSECSASCSCVPLTQVAKHKYLGVWLYAGCFFIVESSLPRFERETE